MDMIKHISRQEFMERAEKMNLEVYEEAQVRSFQSTIVKSIDPTEREHGAIDFASLTREVVINNDLSKSIIFWRPAQIEFKEEIDEVTLLKSRTGYYKDTPENRAKGVVGKPYGDQKVEDRENVGKVSSNFGRMKAEFAAAKKKGDKATMGKIAAQLKLYEAKMKGKEAPQEKEA